MDSDDDGVVLIHVDFRPWVLAVDEECVFSNFFLHVKGRLAVAVLLPWKRKGVG